MEIFPAGHLLVVDHGLYEHVGISDGNGRVYENSNARQGRGLVSYEEFSAGKHIIDLGILPGSLPVPEILSRAQELVKNSKSYHLLTNNCEHFVREICGVEITSPQIQKAVFSALSSVIALKATNPKVKGMAAGVTAGALFTKTDEDLVKNSIIGASVGLLVSLVFGS